MTEKIISESAVIRRDYWIKEIRKLSGKFSQDYERLAAELRREIASQGSRALIDHLRLCGDIPESYAHDSSEEKLYSKYTDTLIAEAFSAIGLKSTVLTLRGDSADVEILADDFSFIADAKAFRLSRTAKNQKDFKVTAMDSWKRGKTYAMVVCPIYQMPTRTSQIYFQACAQKVCIFTYSHLAILVQYSQIEGHKEAAFLLRKIFDVFEAITPSKHAGEYWLLINKVMLAHSSAIRELWQIEKQAAIEAVAIAKGLGLAFLARQREKIMQMSHEAALIELVKMHKIENKIEIIQSCDDNGILKLV